ncbi:hypothetical protein TNCV_2650661 [Trichonephila clavipes]|nr:hypothetical protein TNCV_2650661 [Trichonephila clavipes]
MVLKANDRRTSCPCHDEFRGPRSDYVRQCLFSLGVLDKIKFQEQFHFISAQVPPSGEETRCQNYNVAIGTYYTVRINWDKHFSCMSWYVIISDVPNLLKSVISA